MYSPAEAATPAYSIRSGNRGNTLGVCVFYYCRTYYKAVRVGGGGEWRTCAMRDDEACVDEIFQETQLFPWNITTGLYYYNCVSMEYSPLPVSRTARTDGTRNSLKSCFWSCGVHGSWKWSIVRPAYVCLHLSLLHVLLSQHALGFGERAVDAMVSCRGLF